MNNTIVTVYIMKHGTHGIHKVRIEGFHESVKAALITRNNIYRYVEGRSLQAKIIRIHADSVDLVPVLI